MALLVVGSVAFDSIRTPHGEVEGILGGSATFFSVAASWFGPVKVVAVVGDDFGDEHLEVFRLRSIETTGIERAQGKTFRWRGEYVGDMNDARTLDVQLNVFQNFSPKVPAADVSTEFVFLGNIDPRLQLHVRRQLSKAQLVACDSMNYWIEGSLNDLKETLREVHALVINEGEARMLSGCQNLRKAAKEIQKMGPEILVIKRGEHGVTLFNNGSVFSAPAFMLEEFKDPTGAGDTFAGGFMGHLARTGDLSENNLRRAIVYGSVMASFAVEEFGLKRLLELTPREIEGRVREFAQLTRFDV
ncbi:MAG TPA: PfkB family carbohydrate kinase [Terriglobia bacterium]|nr:PfkB family carbohydrate kinase [Terriglobia bacterium]